MLNTADLDAAVQVYTVTEQAAAGFDLSSLRCTEGLDNETPKRHRHRGTLGSVRRVIARPLLLLLFILLPALGLTPSATATPTAFAPGSLIIPMDATSQNFGMWKAYGLVYKLLLNGVPVHWAIGNPKVPDTYTGTDFTSGSATVQRLGTATTVSPYTYTGGPFIIDSANAAAAQSIINAWWAGNTNQPVIHQITAGTVTANVDLVLRSAPRIALESINAGIAIAYFNAAGIPDGSGRVWTTTSPNILNVGLIGCNSSSASTCPATLGDSALFQPGVCSARKYDVFVTPHNSGYSTSTTDPTNVGTQAYAELDNFVAQGGGWLALCHSILSNENNIAAFYALSPSGATASVRALFKSPVGGGFLTQNGFPVISNKGGSWVVDEPGLPVAQAAATTVANGLPGGSVQTWPSPFNAPTVAGAPAYWSQTEEVAHFDAAGVKYDHVLNGVYHDGNGQGKLTFIGGHSFSTSLPYASNSEGPYLRLFYNALFFNGAAVAKMTLEPSVPGVPQGTATPVQLVFKNAGASVATNVGINGGVTITLAAGVRFVDMATGPAPAVTLGGGGTTILTWGGLGDIAAGATALAINTSITLSVVGATQVATIAAKYGDVFAQSFAENGCTALAVNPTPGAAITKTPLLIGPVNVGDIVTWSLPYSNPGAANLLSPFIEDILPSAFAYVSATPAPTFVVPVAGGTKLRWNLATLPPAGSGSITLRAAVQTATGQPFTNNVTLSGTDATGTVFSATSSSLVSVNPPQAQIDKTVSPTGTVATGATLTYTLRPSSPGPTLLTDLRFFDAPPANTTYVNGSANQGGVFGAYAPIPATQGVDTGPDPQTTMDLTYSTPSPFTQAIGSTVTVTMALRNLAASTGPITNVTASLTPSDGQSSCDPLSAQPVASIPNNNTPVNITFTCTIATYGEISWDGNASGTFLAAEYGFPTATSATLFGVATATGTNVVKWTGMTTDTSTAAIPSVSFAPGTAPGLFAFDGGTAVWERYDVQLNAWVKSPAGLAANLPGNTAAGAPWCTTARATTTASFTHSRAQPARSGATS